MEKIFAIVSVARQVDGDYVFVKPERAFVVREKADSFVNSLVKQYTETLQTPTGPAQCVCTRGVLELEVES